METLLWFVSDSRGGIHQTLVEKEQEYKQHQFNVLAAAHDMVDATVSNRRYDEQNQEVRRQSGKKQRAGRITEVGARETM